MSFNEISPSGGDYTNALPSEVPSQDVLSTDELRDYTGTTSSDVIQGADLGYQDVEATEADEGRLTAGDMYRDPPKESGAGDPLTSSSHDTSSETGAPAPDSSPRTEVEVGEERPQEALASPGLLNEGNAGMKPSDSATALPSARLARFLESSDSPYSHSATGTAVPLDGPTLAGAGMPRSSVDRRNGDDDEPEDTVDQSDGTDPEHQEGGSPLASEEPSRELEPAAGDAGSHDDGPSLPVPSVPPGGEGKGGPGDEGDERDDEPDGDSVDQELRRLLEEAERMEPERRSREGLSAVSLEKLSTLESIEPTVSFDGERGSVMVAYPPRPDGSGHIYSAVEERDGQRVVRIVDSGVATDVRGFGLEERLMEALANVCEEQGVDVVTGYIGSQEEIETWANTFGEPGLVFFDPMAEETDYQGWRGIPGALPMTTEQALLSLSDERLAALRLIRESKGENPDDIDRSLETRVHLGGRKAAAIVSGDALQKAEKLLEEIESDPHAFRTENYPRAIANLAEAAARRGNLPAVLRYRSHLEGLDELTKQALLLAHSSALARICWLGAALGDGSSLSQLQSLLHDERSDLIERQLSHPRLTLEHDALQAVIAQSDQMSDVLPVDHLLTAEGLIDTYSMHDGDEWRLQLDRYTSLDQAGREGARANLDATIERLIPEGAFSHQFVGDNVYRAFEVCEDEFLRAHLVERLTGVMNRVRPGEDNLADLMGVRRTILEEPAYNETLQLVQISQIDEAIRTQIRRLRESGTNTPAYILADSEMEGRILQRAYEGDNPLSPDPNHPELGLIGQIVDFSATASTDMSELTEREFERAMSTRADLRDDWLATMADLYVKSRIPERAEYAKAAIDAMGDSQRAEDAYIRCWLSATDPRQVRELSPEGTLTGELNPQLVRAHVTASVALFAESTNGMIGGAYQLAEFAKEIESNPSRSIYHPFWRLVERLVEDVRETAPDRLPDIARALLPHLQSADLEHPELSQTRVEPILQGLLRSGRRRDFEAAQKAVTDSASHNDTKLILLTYLSYWLDGISTEETAA